MTDSVHLHLTLSGLANAADSLKMMDESLCSGGRPAESLLVELALKAACFVAAANGLDNDQLTAIVNQVGQLLASLRCVESGAGLTGPQGQDSWSQTREGNYGTPN